MRIATLALVSLFGAGIVTAAAAQAQGPRAAAQAPRAAAQDSTQIVEVVGCLMSGPNDTWVMTSATDAVVSDRPSTSTDAVKGAAAKPLGKQRYRLIGVTPFNPAGHVGHKMAVKGLLIKDQKETRINVTSFQMAGASCGK